MDRIKNTDTSATPPTAPSAGTTGYPLGETTPGANDGGSFHPWYLHMLVEEQRNVITSATAGPLTPDFTSTTQLNQAIDAKIAAATPAASETVSGIVELATNAKTVTGTSTTLATHPAGVAAAIAAAISGVTQSVTILTAASGTYTVPAGVTAIDVECVGKGGTGGDGGTGSGNGAGGGGGSGGYARKWYAVTAGQNYAYTVGASSTTFNTTLVANVGSAGSNGVTTQGGAGGSGGTASGGDINLSGGDGSFGSSGDGVSIIGSGGNGGSNPLGFGSKASVAGKSYGGGGGGSATTGAAGGAGAIVIRQYS